MSDWIIFHNPKCSKSRQTLALLEERGIAPQIVEYLKTSPTKEELLKIISALDVPASMLVRRNEDKYKELNFGLDSDESVAANLAMHPSLLERPIVLHKGKAVLGRPPENIDKLF